MIRCEMAGCADMADVVASYEHPAFGKIQHDFCESCADYLRQEIAEQVKITPYANKGLVNKN